MERVARQSAPAAAIVLAWMIAGCNGPLWPTPQPRSFVPPGPGPQAGVQPTPPPPKPAPPKPAGKVNYLYAKEAYQLIQTNRDVFILCCDYKEEYDRGYIPGSALISVGYLVHNLEKNRMWPEINHGRVPRKDQPILLYCMGKNCICPSIPTYSALAKKILVEKGFLDIRILAGSFPEWKKAKLPYNVTPGATTRPAGKAPATKPAK